MTRFTQFMGHTRTEKFEQQDQCHDQMIAQGQALKCKFALIRQAKQLKF